MCKNKPANAPRESKSKPKVDYGIEWVHGYRTEDTRMNLVYNTEGQLVYPAATLGIIYDYKK
jgi:hypothetical protein